MTVGNLFALDSDGRVNVQLMVRREGERFVLTHTFRRPSVADKKEFWAQLGALPDSSGAERNNAYLSAQEQLYDKCVTGVQGYDIKQDGQESERRWLALIPLEHKLWAVEQLLAKAGNLERDAAKN